MKYILTPVLLWIVVYEYIGLFKINSYCAYWLKLTRINEDIKSGVISKEESNNVVAIFAKSSKIFAYYFLTDVVYTLCLWAMIITRAWLIAIIIFGCSKLLSKIIKSKGKIRHSFRKWLIADKIFSVILITYALALLWR